MVSNALHERCAKCGGYLLRTFSRIDSGDLCAGHPTSSWGGMPRRVLPGA